MVSKAKNPDRQRALVLVVCKGAMPATLLCDALLCGVARQRTPYMYAISIQHMSKEFYRSHEQVTLAFLYMQLKVLELCKHLVQKLTVLSQGLRIDVHIIQVHQNTTVQGLKDDMIHHPLEV